MGVNLSGYDQTEKSRSFNQLVAIWDFQVSTSPGGGHSGLKRYPLANGCGSGERQNSELATSFWGKTGGDQFQTKNIIGVLAYNLWLYSLYFIGYMAFFL